jgi:ariadne-1
MFKVQSKAKLQKSEGRLDVEKYVHYYHRYNEHEQSKQFEVKLREDAVAHMACLKDQESWKDVSFVEKATETLLQVRSSIIILILQVSTYLEI